MSFKYYNTLFIGKVLVNFPVLESTNNYALNLLSKNKPTEGTVVSTTHQVAGRGQYGSSWVSEAGKNITISIILYPSFLSVRHQFMLNKAVSLAVYDFVSHYIKPELVHIKWPNDLFVENKKMGGILIQNSLKGHQIASSVIGIGLNINQSTFPDELPNPISFTTITDQSYSIKELSRHLYKMVELRYLQLRDNKWEKLNLDYLRALYRLGRETTFRRKNGDLFKGVIKGIAEDGKLLVTKQEDQAIEGFYFKEISFNNIDET